MRFEKSIDIDAPQQRVWDVLSEIEAWPERIETVDSVELLTPAPMTNGSRVRLKQPKLPEGTWDVTVWDAPSYFEWTQKMTGTPRRAVRPSWTYCGLCVNAVSIRSWAERMAAGSSSGMVSMRPSRPGHNETPEGTSGP